MKYTSLWPTFILKSNFRWYWLIIRKNGVCTWNCFQYIRQNYWLQNTGHCDLHLFYGQTLGHMAHNLKVLFRTAGLWNIGHHDLIYFEVKLPVFFFIINGKYGVYDKRQNHCIMKYRSLWSTFILPSILGSYWHIIHKYNVYTSSILQDIKQIIGL